MPAPRRPLRATLALIAASLAGCTLQSDAEYATSQSRRAREQHLQGMRQATWQTPRGTDLAGDALLAALSGKTLVNRYEKAPGGRPGPYVMHQYFAPDGRFVYSESPRVIHWPGSGDANFRWRIEGAQRERLCIQGPPAETRWRCFRMARAADGALQWFIAEPGDTFDGQLTIVTREITNGPPGP